MIKELYIALLFFAILTSCENKKESHDLLIKKILDFKERENRFPRDLSEVDESASGYCYYFCGPDFCLEYTQYDDLYYYNSYLGWDYLENDADKFHCSD